MQAGDVANGLKRGNSPLPKHSVLSGCNAFPIVVFRLRGLISVLSHLLTLLGLNFASSLGGHRRGIRSHLTILG
jgi:hypothetical protein